MARRPPRLNATVKSRSALKVEDPRAQKLKHEQAHSLPPRVFSQGSERQIHNPANPLKGVERRLAVRYGERQPPELRSIDCLIKARVANAPRTATPTLKVFPATGNRFNHEIVKVVTNLSRTILHGRHAISCRSALTITISIWEVSENQPRPINRRSRVAA